MMQVALRAFPQWMSVFVKSENFGPYEYVMEEFNILNRVRSYYLISNLVKTTLLISNPETQKRTHMMWRKSTLKRLEILHDRRKTFVYAKWITRDQKYNQVAK